MEIGKIIKQYRDEHDLTMQQLADRAGLSKGYISMLERGRHPQNNREIIPSIDTVQKLAVAMNMTIDSLLQLCGDQQIEIPETAGRPDVNALFIDMYGKRVFDIAMQLVRLDDEDLGRIAERIDMLLESEKYKRGLSERKVI